MAHHSEGTQRDEKKKPEKKPNGEHVIVLNLLSKTRLFLFGGNTKKKKRRPESKLRETIGKGVSSQKEDIATETVEKRTYSYGKATKRSDLKKSLEEVYGGSMFSHSGIKPAYMRKEPSSIAKGEEPRGVLSETNNEL